MQILDGLVEIVDARTPTFYFCDNKDFSIILDKHIAFIKEYALRYNKSSRICLHKNETSDLHNMVIAHVRGGYIRPHKNIFKSKAYQILDGEMRVIGIDDERRKIFDITLGNEKMLRIEPNVYLLLLPISNVVVFHEIALGPFVKDGEKAQVYAEFSPKVEEAEKIREFIDFYAKD